MTLSNEDVDGVSVSEDENTGRPVRVRWLDSGLSVHIGWAGADKHKVPCTKVETVGIWLGETDDMLFVAASRDADNENWLGSQTIWRPSVQVIEWLDGNTEGDGS